MSKLDLDALLAKNPQVDRKLLKENQEKAAAAKKLPAEPRKEPLVVSPYGGRRMLSDDTNTGRSRFYGRPPHEKAAG